MFTVNILNALMTLLKYSWAENDGRVYRQHNAALCLHVQRTRMVPTVIPKYFSSSLITRVDIA